MSYFLLYGAFALWVLLDGLSRRMRLIALLWMIATIAFGPLALPIYLALRPLKSGEVREGGTAWNILKNFAILWTLAMVITGAIALIAIAWHTTGLNNEWEIAGAGVGMVLGLAILGAAWLLPTAGAVLIGLLVKKNSALETGPTGQLIGHSSAVTQAGGWAGVALAAFLGIILVGLASWFSRTPETKSHATSTDLAPFSAPSQADSANDWVLANSTDPMDGTPLVTLTRSGTDDSSLMIRCAKHKTDAYVDTNAVVDNGAVRIKFDQGAPMHQSWTRSTDYKALFAPDAVSFARQLSKAKMFMFEYTPFQEGARSISFDVSDLGPKLQRISDACNWAGVDQANARARAADAALRARLAQYVHPCADQSIGKWCWSDPNDVLFKSDSGFETTREKALDDAVEEAKAGLAFTKE